MLLWLYNKYKDFSESNLKFCLILIGAPGLFVYLIPEINKPKEKVEEKATYAQTYQMNEIDVEYTIW